MKYCKIGREKCFKNVTKLCTADQLTLLTFAQMRDMCVLLQLPAKLGQKRQQMGKTSKLSRQKLALLYIYSKNLALL